MHRFEWMIFLAYFKYEQKIVIKKLTTELNANHELDSQVFLRSLCYCNQLLSGWQCRSMSNVSWCSIDIETELHVLGHPELTFKSPNSSKNVLFDLSNHGLELKISPYILRSKAVTFHFFESNFSAHNFSHLHFHPIAISNFFIDFKVIKHF